MDIARALELIGEEELRAEVEHFLKDFMTPAFGSLPKREIELRVFDLMRNLGILQTEATIYSLMTDLMVTRTKASQLIFDLEIRRYGSDRHRLDELIKNALINTKFAKDGDYFVMEIENPLTLAHLRQRIREIGHFSDTSFNSALVRAPLDTVTDLMLNIIPDAQHEAVKRALIDAGAPDRGVKAVIKGALKTLGSKIIGEAADQVAEGLVDNSANFLEPLVNAGIGQIRERWQGIFAAEQNDE
ncbi:hypothetical protein FIV06_08285 [Labrenzia sp. THAF191b]|uniref:hypothetical protein n=1 Tax=unclassified Labrenzia TaxID=2648686 RepID=UPI001268518B|nr:MULTISPECIES: hypothetical protein [unclassified Labrenzia]QFS97416.1 hypothetical protein FIV06_08285 [Labrenzia sp. THAF191b]QFT03731.1 hypothetical protein FIV05_08285 [Labrenzia sp. THAF191a]QFT15273.1 hypothetical protein FIV03_08290 [Labrenzia sp. THAF187b]